MLRTLDILEQGRAVGNTGSLPAPPRESPLDEDRAARARRRAPARARSGRDRLVGLPELALARPTGRRVRQSVREPGRVDPRLDVANRQIQIDVSTFVQWVDAYAREDAFLSDFYRKRFRPEFATAVDAWVATRPLKSPDAPLTPFAMPEYKLASAEEAEQLEATASAAADVARLNIQRADNYTLCLVLFSAALFFAGFSTRFQSLRIRRSRSRSAGSSSSRPSSGSRRSRSRSPSRAPSPPRGTSPPLVALVVDPAEENQDRREEEAPAEEAPARPGAPSKRKNKTLRLPSRSRRR